MSEQTPTSTESLLARLAGLGLQTGAENPWSSIKSTQPNHDLPTHVRVEQPPATSNGSNAKAADTALEIACQRITNLVKTGTATPNSESQSGDSSFTPIEPTSFEAAGVMDAEIEALILKFLFNRGAGTGRDIADQVRLPFKMVEELLRQMKNEQLVIYKAGAPMNDYLYTITDMGRERGRRLFQQCTYFGSAPVTLEDYIASVKAQSIEKQRPTVDNLRKAFADLLLSQRMLNRLGPAINSGRGLFLYGAPGNGKTSIAERATRAFGQTIWIPRALSIEGSIIRLFDPSNHEEMPLENRDSLIDHSQIDKRWVRIRRPTIVVGGELTMDSLEITTSPLTNISEAPLQMKSNCGTLVIDDFGRQRMRTDELLNRWIVPLEKRYDFLNMPNGKKIQVPFDQLIIFSTNLEPKALVDDAFLRRIPYKIDVIDPTEEEFRELFELMSTKLGFVFREDAVNYLIEKHYKSVNRPFRCCQPRDLLLQVRNFCYYQCQPLEMSKDNFDFAVENYFAVM